MKTLGKFLAKIVLPFIKGGKVNWFAVVAAILCVLLVVFNAPEGFGRDVPQWAGVTKSSFNWMTGIYLLIQKYL